MNNYAELHAHSAYSFGSGANQPEELAAQAAALGLTGCAITDYNGLYGVVRFAQGAREVGIPTIFGAELHLDGRGFAEKGAAQKTGPRKNAGGFGLSGESCGEKEATEKEAASKPPAGRLNKNTPLGINTSCPLVVLARGPEGYRRLSSAIAHGHLAAGKKGATLYSLAELGRHCAGSWLVLSGGPEGPVQSALSLADGQQRARQELELLVAAFGKDNVLVEINDDATAICQDRNVALAALASDAGLGLVATGNVYAARPGDADLADALTAIRCRSSLDDIDGWLPGTGTTFLCSAAEMYRRHKAFPHAVAATVDYAAECAFDLQLVAPRLPPFPVPSGHNESTWLRELVCTGARKRYGSPTAETIPGAYAQLEHELRVIETLNFPGYFLLVHDLVEFCRNRGILAQGRGSAANSAVCFALGITAVDAVRHGLLFERFLAPERDGPPDIDIDIESGRREEVIQYLYTTYGRERAAQVANVISYRPRSAVRDAARALGYGPGQQDAWSKNIERRGSLGGRPAGRPAAVTDVPSTAPRQSTAESDELAGIPTPVIDLAERLLQLPRHLGIHPGGMVMCDRPVIEVCPVEWARMPGRTVLQWDKDDCADAGLVKFDLLGLGMLTALRITFDFIKEHEGLDLGLHSLPQEDPAVYDLLCAADTVGVFQVESRAQMATLPRLQPRRFYDIVVEVALIRPGPIQGGSVHPYINRVRGREQVTYLHPLLEKSLARTLGVPLFQEQLMQIAIDVADFTAAESDQLRRAMGSKRSVTKMEAMHKRFTAGTDRNGISRQVSEEIFDKLRGFSDFGFPESHAYSFAYLVYASAWLKVHHPAAFLAGLIGAQPMGFYSVQSLVADFRRHGVNTLRPCLLSSQVKASVEAVTAMPAPTPDLAAAEQKLTTALAARGGRKEGRQQGKDPDITFKGGSKAPTGEVLKVASAYCERSQVEVRLGLENIRGVSARLASKIVAARNERIFEDLNDLVSRVELSTATLEALATAGALACLGVSRREGIWSAGALSRVSPSTLTGVSVGSTAPMLPEMDEVEEAVADVWATGLTTATHPMEFVRAGLKSNAVKTVQEAAVTTDRTRIAVGGVVTHRQRPATAKGVTFLSLEDETGLLNVVVSETVWKRFRQVARRCAALVVWGMIERADGAVNLIAEHIRPLSLQVKTRSRDFR